MKREVERRRKLPAFSIEIDDLEVLWSRLLPLFDSSKTVHSTIKISLLSETLEFTSVEELKNYAQLRGRITKFSHWISQTDQHISINTLWGFASLAEVHATGKTEAWCAGATETVYSFLQSHRVWYHWISSAPTGWMYFAVCFAPIIAELLLPKETVLPRPLLVAWIVALAPLMLLFFFKQKLFPPAIILATVQEGFFRRYSAELSLLMAFISILIGVIGWLWGK